MPFFVINNQGHVVAVADTLPTQDQLQAIADRISSTVHVVDGRDTGLSAEPSPAQPAAPKSMHLSGLGQSGTTAMLRVEDLNLDPQEEIIGLLASLPERDRRLLARELRHRLVP
jgi:hypothetical protein